MQKNEIHMYDNNGIQIIEKKDETVSNLISQLDNWHDELSHIILYANNLYCYATNNVDSDYYLDELS